RRLHHVVRGALHHRSRGWRNGKGGDHGGGNQKSHLKPSQGMEASVVLAREIRIFHCERFGKKRFFLLRRNDRTGDELPRPTSSRVACVQGFDDQGLGFGAILPVAISVSQAAGPRAAAWQR